MKYSISLLAAAAAVNASPLLRVRQAVTSAISPSAAAPSGCSAAYSGTFGIAAMNISTPTGKAKRQASTISDGQPQVPTSNSVSGSVSVAPITTISDGQPQASTEQPMSTIAPVTQLSDGQPNVGSMTTMIPVTQISDGQVQAPTMTMAPVGQISDGQIQATTGTAISQISDGQPQAPTATATGISTISDNQPQAPTGTGVSTASDNQPQAPTGTGSGSSPESTVMVACRTNSTLEMSVSNGVLKDNQGRTGYIAANYQFQFDEPPQAGAIYTSGFSVCGNGSLALGGSTTFYQCLSGDFYNLYDRSWAAQCNPVTIEVLQLQDCPSS
ncbi:MAG: hypothetical protein Q9227_002702 [Pyrenula ochraceoflavens]